MQNNQKMDQEKPQVLTEAEINQVSGGRRGGIRPRPGQNGPGNWVSSIPVYNNGLGQSMWSWPPIS